MAPYPFTKLKRDNITARMNDLLSEMASEEVTHIFMIFFQWLISWNSFLKVSLIVETSRSLSNQGYDNFE